jgi:hypothetical protein
VHAFASHWNNAFNFIEKAMHLMDFLYIFGLVSERFGDGDTSHVGLDIEEVIFLCLRLNVFASWVGIYIDMHYGRYGFTVFLIFSDSTYI